MALHPNHPNRTLAQAYLKEALMVGRYLYRPFTLLIQHLLQTLPPHNSANNMATIDQRFDLDRAEDRLYLKELQDTYMSDVAISDTEGNETDRVLSSQLILITTVVITGNIVVLGNKELLDSLSQVQQILISAGLLGLVLSLYMGIKYFQTIREFHRGWGDTRYSIVLELKRVKTGDTYSDLSTKIDNLLNSVGANIDERYLNRQVRILLAALFIYLVLVISLVANFTHWTSRWCWYRTNTTSECRK